MIGYLYKQIEVLGSEYNIIVRKYEDDPFFEKLQCVAYCDEITGEIIMGDLSTFKVYEGDTDERLKLLFKSYLRHEIIHCFLNESGLSSSVLVFDSAWAKNEEMVDWVATQSPKIFGLFNSLGLL